VRLDHFNSMLYVTNQMTLFQLKEYLDGDRSPYADWFNGLDAVAAARIDRYVRRMEQGNFGYSSHVGGGVQELHIDFGPGYRVYYGKDGEDIIILLGGGSKRGQSRDIAEAIGRWERFKRRKSEMQAGR
jgi:putative addiction module killer protein